MDNFCKVQEALTVIWEEKEKGYSTIDEINKKIIEKTEDDIISQLEKSGYVTIENKIINFTSSGEKMAKDIIRRQRLAERLLVDVLDVGANEMNSSACELEHILSKEVEESICTLLGHPKECPHGLVIPQGDCCLKAKVLIERIVVPLTSLSPGNKAKIVYVLTHKHPQLHKLMSFGIVPGARIVVHQKSPSFIIKVEETQIAFEEEIAREIYVKRL